MSRKTSTATATSTTTTTTATSSPEIEVPIATTIPREERIRRDRRKGSYHLVASKNKLPDPNDPLDEEDSMLFQFLTSNVTNKQIKNAKIQLLRVLAASSGDVSTIEFKQALQTLTDLYDPTIFDSRILPSKGKSDDNNKTSFRNHRKNNSSSRQNHNNNNNNAKPSPNIEGMWITLSKPKFEDCLGYNQQQQLQYTLGRMTFNMFQPIDLICSIQGTFNPVHIINNNNKKNKKDNIPKEILSKMNDLSTNVLRSYDVVTAFTIEPKTNNANIESSSSSVVVNIERPIQGLMTTYGYVIPNPDHTNRLSVFFTGGTMEVIDPDLQTWRSIFHTYTKIPSPKTSLSSKTLQPPSPPQEQRQQQQQQTQIRKNGIFRRRTTKTTATTDSCNNMPIHAININNSGSNDETDYDDNNNNNSNIYMESDGRMAFTLDQPAGSRGQRDQSYIDIVYLDETLRIAISNHDAIFVFARVPYFPDE